MNFLVRIILISTIILGTSYMNLLQKDGTHADKWKQQSQPKAITASTINGQKTIIFERVYIDGEVSEEIKHIDSLNAQDIMEKYKEWLLVDLDEDQIVIQKKVDDISPLLKANGYFGVTEDGTLSIFNGKPSKSDIIQSFFQIDIKKLEGKKKEELKKGIPIKTKEDYDKVLEALRRYSIPATKE